MDKRPGSRPTHYVLAVTGGVEVDLHGPWRSAAASDAAARKIHAKQDPECDSLFWARLAPNGKMKMGSYPAGFFEDT